MRFLLIAVLAASCGGSSDQCQVAGEHDFTATRVEVADSRCADLPQTIAAHLSLQMSGKVAAGTITEASVAHPVSYSTNVNACFVEVAWYESGSPAVAHSYVLQFGGESYLSIARLGVCMARYSLR